MSSLRACQHCGCSEIETDPGRGDAVCTNCGSVLEENIIVNEVQFEENCRGGSSALGQFVSVDGKVSGSLMSGNFSHQMGKESRQITLNNGRSKITEIAGQLRLNQHCIDTAFNFYKMMVSRRLTRGRKLSHVIASCVYIVCRTEGTPHMLLDLSDIVQVNVYELGKTYLKLSTELHINIPALDPCLYIMRFAHKLEFGDKTHEVSMTALRLVQRMKRDWIHTGRRPSGLCGAALLVAARLHDFNRTMQDIIKVVKIGLTTLRNRLTEFGETPTSRLTLDEFMNIDLEEEQDPPSYKAARRKHKLQMMEDHKVDQATSEVGKLQRMIEKALIQQKMKGRYAKEYQLLNQQCNESDSEENGSADEEVDDINNFLMEDTVNMIQSVVEVGNEETVVDHPLPHSTPEMRGPGPSAASLGLKQSIDNCMTVKQDPVETEDNGELDLDGIDDEELDSYLMNDKEVKRKTQMWNMINADYIEQQKIKEEQLARLNDENANKPEKKKRKYRKRNPVIQANSAGEAIEKMLQEKRISHKINYDVLRNLNTATCLQSLAKANDQMDNPAANAQLEPQPQTAKSSRFKRRVSFSQNVLSMPSPSKMSKVKEEDVAEQVDDDEASASIDPDQNSKAPLRYEQQPEEEEEEEEEEETEKHVSAAELLRQHAGEQDEYSSHDEYLE